MNKNKLPYARAICYSGYRDGQSPGSGTDPSYRQVKEDLLILQGQWQSLRLYASDTHSRTVLKVIHQEKMAFDVMLGAYITAEVSNPGCPWGANFDDATLKKINVITKEKYVN